MDKKIFVKIKTSDNCPPVSIVKAAGDDDELLDADMKEDDAKEGALVIKQKRDEQPLPSPNTTKSTAALASSST